MSVSSSPRRQRQSRSSRQWSSREASSAVTLPPVGVGEVPLHLERPCDALAERALEIGPALRQVLEAELHAHEERPALGVGRVLVRAEDVRVVLGKEPRDGGDDPVSVRARDEQTGDVLSFIHALQAKLAFGVDGSHRPAGIHRTRGAIGCRSRGSSRRSSHGSEEGGKQGPLRSARPGGGPTRPY